MAKKPTLSGVSNILNSESVINDNWEAIQEAFDNTLSLDGSTPNQMDADLDLNSNDLLNVGIINTSTLKINGQTTTSLVSVPNWESTWATSTSYEINDFVRQNGNIYICLEAHSSGIFSTDLSAGKWELMVTKGDTGDGTGDLLSTNNLSDLDDADTALTNLGGGSIGISIFKDNTSAAVRSAIDVEPGVDVQTQNASLQDLADISPSEGDIIYFDGVNFVNLGIGSADQTLTVNSGATAPEWSAPSTGVGEGQTWTDVSSSRLAGTSYQNTTGKPIQCSITTTVTSSNTIEVSTDNSTWVALANTTADRGHPDTNQFIVPNGHYYRVVSGATINIWAELR